MSEIEIFYNTTLPVGDDIKSGRPCSIIHFNPKTYEVTGEEHYNLENVKVPDHAIESLARAFLPAIQDFYASEEGQKVKERLDRERAEKEALKNLLNFVTLCCGILTIETSDCFFRSFCFIGQNGAFSTTEQNQ